MERQQRKEDTTLVPRYVTIIITIIISDGIIDVVTIDHKVLGNRLRLIKFRRLRPLSLHCFDHLPVQATTSYIYIYSR